MAKVYNKRHDKVPPDAVYVGRPSYWGNPWRAADLPGGRDAAVNAFAGFMADDEVMQQRARDELRGRDLVCWCAPRRCHADVILHYANA